MKTIYTLLLALVVSLGWGMTTTAEDYGGIALLVHPEQVVLPAYGVTDNLAPVVYTNPRYELFKSSSYPAIVTLRQNITQTNAITHRRLNRHGGANSCLSRFSSLNASLANQLTHRYRIYGSDGK